MNGGIVEAPAPSYVRYACLAAVVFLFALPCIVGRLTTYFVLLFALFVILTPSLAIAWRERSRNPIDLMFVVAAALPSVAFLFSAEDASDLLYAFNFLPLLLAIPFRWQIEKVARADAALIIGWLSILGTIIAVAVAAVQLWVLHYDRVGQPLMNPFQFADTAMLLGFTGLVPLFAPGTHRRWPFLVAPVLGILAAVMGGTRGALIAAPVLGLVALGFALAQSRSRAAIFGVAAGFVLVAGVVLFAAVQLGLDRAIDGFFVTRNVIAGGAVDQSTYERLVMLQGGWQAFLQAPVFGYGWVDMVPAIYPHVPVESLPRMQTFRQLHNGLLSFAVGAGLFGVASFVILAVAPVVAVFFTARDALFASRLYLAVTLCAGYAVFQLTIIMIGFEFHTVQYAFMTMVFIGFVAVPAKANAPAYSAPGKAEVGPETAKTA